MKNWSKEKKFFTFAAFSFLFLIPLVWLKARAQTSPLDKTATEYEEAVQTPSLEALTEDMFGNTIMSALRTLVRTDENGNPTGALPFTTQLIAALYSTPPASGIYYAYDVLHRLGATPVYAQGAGFTGLQPILPLWKAFRNVTYVIFTLVFIVIGLAITFRIKISPQAVITIENALPKIIGALILVTFSYAIAGFLIDLMYVVMFLAFSILSQNLGIDFTTTFRNFSFGDLAGSMAHSVFYAFDDLLALLISGNWGIMFTTLGIALGAILGTLISPGGGTVIGAIIGGFGGTGVGAALITLILLGAVFFSLISLLFKLIKLYIGIILQIVFSPLIIMLGVLPGGKINFSSWIKDLIGKLLVFPSIAVLVLISIYFSRQFSLLEFYNFSMWIPPFLGNWGSGAARGSLGLIGLGMILFIPKVPDIIPKIIGTTDLGFGSAIGQTLSPALATLSWPFREGWSTYRGAQAKFVQDEITASLRAIGRGTPWRDRASLAVSASAIPIFGRPLSNLISRRQPQQQQTRRSAAPQNRATAASMVRRNRRNPNP